MTTLAALGLGLFGSAAAQELELSARDMFRNPGRLFGKASSQAKDSASQTKAQPSQPTPPSREAAKTKPSESAEVAKAETSPKRTERPPVTPRPPRRPARDTQAQVIEASLEPEDPQIPLGLRYSILKQQPGGGIAEVDADTVFRSGDRIRLSIESNDTAYLYIVAKGSSGRWNVLFPSKEIADGNNRIEPGHRYSIPARHWFAFDDQVGEEQLFILLSRQPEDDLEGLIYSLQNPDAEPASTAPEEEPSKVLLAQNLPSLEDNLIDQLRNRVYTRDLVFEKVDEQTPGDQKEKAVYIVNRTGSDDSRVRADIKLKHQ